MERVQRALATGMFMNAARLEGTQYNPLAPESDPGTHMYCLVRHTGQQGRCVAQTHIMYCLVRHTGQQCRCVAQAPIMYCLPPASSRAPHEAAPACLPATCCSCLQIS